MSFFFFMFIYSEYWTYLRRYTPDRWDFDPSFSTTNAHLSIFSCELGALNSMQQKTAWRKSCHFASLILAQKAAPVRLAKWSLNFASLSFSFQKQLWQREPNEASILQASFCATSKQLSMTSLDSLAPILDCHEWRVMLFGHSPSGTDGKHLRFYYLNRESFYQRHLDHINS